MDMEEDQPNETWKAMDIGRTVLTLAALAGLMGFLLYLTCSNASGFGLLLSILVGWAAFCVAAIGGTFLSILLWWAVEILTVWIPAGSSKERLYLGLRWLYFVAGLLGVLYLGGRGVYDGLQNNRLVDAGTLYERCMEPQWRTVEHRRGECADGWRSPSIGLRGACSYHGGVVWRSITRREQYQAHSAKYCRTDASARSWLD